MMLEVKRGRARPFYVHLSAFQIWKARYYGCFVNGRVTTAREQSCNSDKCSRPVASSVNSGLGGPTSLRFDKRGSRQKLRLKSI